MTNHAGAQVIVLADHPLARRKRARRFWGTMGVVLRLEERRNARPDDNARVANRLPAVRITPRAPRGR